MTMTSGARASAALEDLVQALQSGELHERAIRGSLPVGLHEHAHGWKQHLQQYASTLSCRKYVSTSPMRSLAPQPQVEPQR